MRLNSASSVRQRDFKEESKVKEGIFLKMKSSDDGREMSFQMLRETCLDSTSQEREYNSLKYKFHSKSTT